MFRPLLRARHMALLVVVCALGLAACVKPAPAPRPQPQAPPSGQPSGLAGDFFALHNNVRAQNGRAALGYDGNAASHAQFHAGRTQSNPTACTGHSTSGELQGWYPGVSAGENIYCLSTCAVNPQQVMDGWMNSSGGHKTNILNSGFRAMGVGISCNGGRAFIVVHFHG